MMVCIGFSKRANNIVSNIICWAESTDYSHVYIRIKSKYGEYVYQASGLQVNFTNIATFLAHNEIIEEYEFNVTEEQKSKLLTFCIKHAGKDYALSMLFKLSAILVCNKLGVPLTFEGDDNDSFICSELGAVFCEDILGMDIPEDADFITPRKLNPYIKTFGKRVI